MNAIRIDDRVVGEGNPCFIVAEVGINHNGDLGLCHKLIDAAAEVGADAVKFQNYRTDDFIFDGSLTYTYVRDGKKVVEKQYDLFKRCELPRNSLPELLAHCKKKRLVFFSTPSSVEGVKDLLALDVKVLKNGSDYLTNLEIIKAMAQTGLPTIISTGMATLSEVQDAVKAFSDSGGKDLILLVCTSVYPTPLEDVNLLRIPTLKNETGCPIGFSDHTEGFTAAIGAVTLGACVIEKHFTLDKKLPGPDHPFSADPEEFGQMVMQIRNIEKCLGRSDIMPATSEEFARREFRLSCIAIKELKSGHNLTESDIAFGRPGTGFPPKEKQNLLGKKLVRNVSKGHPFVPDDFT